MRCWRCVSGYALMSARTSLWRAGTSVWKNVCASSATTSSLKFSSSYASTLTLRKLVLAVFLAILLWIRIPHGTCMLGQAHRHTQIHIHRSHSTHTHKKSVKRGVGVIRLVVHEDQVLRVFREGKEREFTSWGASLSEYTGSSIQSFRAARGLLRKARDSCKQRPRENES